MKLYKFKSFINEVVTPRSELYPKDKIHHVHKEDPALFTWDEYFNDMQQGALHKWHDSSAYNYNVNSNAYSWVNLNDGNWRKIQTKKYDNIVIEFYQNIEERQYVSGRDNDGNLTYRTKEEFKEQGKLMEDYSIVAYHKDEDLIIGAAQDEWGSVLISVLKEYRGLGIADDLEDMYRYYFPNKGTGGVTDSGYKMLKRFHARRVRKYLQNGIYSDMVRHGELTASRAKEIINSIDKKRYVRTGTEFSKTYGGSKELMYYIDDNVVIIFDKSIKEAFDREDPERFTKRLIKCFIYANQFKEVNYENIFTAYAENEQFLKIGIDMLLSAGFGLSDYWIHKRFDKKTAKYMDNIFKNNEYKLLKDKHYEHDRVVRIISLKEDKYNFNKLKRDSTNWFAKNDQHDEFKNRLMEFAEGIADLN